MEASIDSQKTWGIYLSMTYDFSKGINPNYPEWAAKSDFHCQGPTKLIIWNETEHKSAVLTAIESLNLMDRLLVGGDWQTIGVSITRKVLKFQIQISRKKKKNDKGKPDEDPAASEKSQWVDEILLRLPPQAGFGLLELLQNNQTKLMALAEEEHQMQVKTLTRVYDQIFEWGRNAEEKEVNFLSRIVAWTRLKKPNHWVCTSGENRGAIHPLGWSNWSASIEINRKQRKHRSDFVKLIDAVNWVENEIQHPDVDQTNSGEMDQEEDREERLAQLHENVKRYPLQIKPEDMDSNSISYQIVIDVESNPIHKETYETEFGDIEEYGKKYLTPTKISALIGIDPDYYQIEQPFGQNSKWCRFIGLTTYHLESLAISQVQNVWDQSKITAQFKAGTVIRARYGYMESETKYPVYIGECSNSSLRWGGNQDRREFLEKNAFRLSVFHSLQVSDLRCYLNMDSETMNDNELLTLMHETRAESTFISIEEKLKSQLWLYENKLGVKK